MDKLWWQEEVVYQIYPKSFYDSNQDGIGDLKGITQKLDYLDKLGVTMLWLCPFYQSPMADNGYDVSDYHAIAPEFGTMEDLEELIEKARNRGIKIMIDLVVNHTSDEHDWFQRALKNPESEFRDYYIFKEGEKEPNNWRSVFGGSVWEKVCDRPEYYLHTFGKKQSDLNWENPHLRDKVYEMINWWLDKGIAGFRVDAITFIKKDLTWKNREADGVDGLADCAKASQNQAGIGTLLKELKEHAFDGRNCVTIAEAPGVSYNELGEFIGDNGYFSMIFDFRYADLDIAPGGEWFKRTNWTVKDLRDKIMESQMEIQKYGWSANFIENHDQPRATTKYLGMAEDNPNAVKALSAMYFFLRGMPFIYQGQELGMTNFKRDSIKEFNDISSIDQYYRAIEEGYSSEKALWFINQRSRDNARTPFPWNDEKYGGFSSAQSWIAMSDENLKRNAQVQTGMAGSILEFYREIIQFRQHGPYCECLIYGNIEPVESSQNVIAYRRFTEEENIYCWFNLSSTETEEHLPYKDVEQIWGNYGKADVQKGILKLLPYQAVMLKTIRR